MAGADRRSQQLDGLLGEPLPDLEPLRGRHRDVDAAFVLSLFTVDLRPLGLVTDG
jgi:hypothetical protein